MKILLLQDAEWRKKGPHQQHHLMEFLSLEGYEILVIGFDQLWKEDKGSFYSKRLYEPDICRFYENAKVSFIRPAFIRFPLLDYISFLFTSRIEISRQISEFNPDLIIGFSSILSNYWGLKYAKKLKIPYLYYCYDNPSSLLVPKPFVAIAEYITVNIMKESDKVLTINKALNDYVISLGADPSTTEVLPQGVDISRFITTEKQRENIRFKYNIASDDILLFFMGWLYPFSGLKEIILEIYKNKDIKNIKLMIVGYGEDDQNLKNLIKSLNISNRVIMTGKKPYEEIPELISAADICILPAHNDKIIQDIVPIKLYEYLAMHKPVITTKLPGVMKEFEDNDGLITYVDKPEDVLKTVLDMESNFLEEKQLKAKDFIKDYDWKIIISNFEIILKNMI